jgi:hypothetical protein
MGCKFPSRTKDLVEINYDVFVIFRGPDTRFNFTDHLFGALQRRGINAFRDDTKLKKGEFIEPGLFNAIEASQVYIVVFSKNYASIQLGACENWNTSFVAVKNMENVFLLFSMMLILIRCKSKVVAMVKPYPNMDSNMTQIQCKDGEKLSHKWGISLAGIYVISKQSSLLYILMLLLVQILKL